MAIAVASVGARSVLRSAAVRNAASRLASAGKPVRSPFSSASRISLCNRVFRFPVEMSACLETIKPYHTATALALMTSLLTASRCGFSWLPEGFLATPSGILSDVLFPSFLFLAMARLDEDGEAKTWI